VQEEKSAEESKESVSNDKDTKIESHEKNPRDDTKQKNQTNEDTKFVSC
jgi:hypothetical protein